MCCIVTPDSGRWTHEPGTCRNNHINNNSNNNNNNNNNNSNNSKNSNRSNSRTFLGLERCPVACESTAEQRINRRRANCCRCCRSATMSAFNGSVRPGDRLLLQHEQANQVDKKRIDVAGRSFFGPAPACMCMHAHNPGSVFTTLAAREMKHKNFARRLSRTSLRKGQ